MQKYSHILLVLGGAVMISFSGVLVKLAEVQPTTSAFYRMLFGCCFLFIASRFLAHNRTGDGAPQPVAQPTIRATSAEFGKSTESGRWLLLMFCGLTFALDLFFWHSSIISIGPGLATILSNFQVFLLAAAGFFFFGEQLRPRYLSSLPLAITGLFLIIGFRWSSLDQSYRMGIVYGLLTALCYAAYLLSMRRLQSMPPGGPSRPLQQRQPSGTTSFHHILHTLMLVSVFSAIFLGILMFLQHDSFAIPSLNALFCLLGLGLLCQTVGWGMIASSLPKLRTSLAGLMLLLQPTLSFIWDVLFFDRPTGLQNWCGVVLTLMAIYMGTTGKKSERRTRNKAVESAKIR